MKKIFYISFLAALISCAGEKSDDNTELNSGTVANETSVITLTKEQIDLAKIETGKIERQLISEKIECTGIIEALPQNVATVSPLINGFVKTLLYYPGEYVKEGAILATLNHPDFINLQQKYLEAKSEFDYYQEEYKRQGELTVENAASIKKMQQAKADYLKSEAIYTSLKNQLELLGVNTEMVDKGNFTKEFKLTAPISGTVSQLNTNKGKLVNTSDAIYEIVDFSSLNINMRVFEKDISQVKKNQKVAFKTLNSDKKYTSTVKRIGIKVVPSDRTVLVQAGFNNTNLELNHGMFINASIYINERESFVISDKAVMQNVEGSFIFISKDNSFQKIRVQKGFEEEGLIEIRDPDNNLLDADIVINGAYFLMSTAGESE